MGEGGDERDERVLVFGLGGGDAEHTVRVLAERGIDATICGNGHALCREMEGPVGAVLLAEEAFVAPTAQHLLETLARQPPWSDLPIIVTAVERESVAGGHEPLSRLTEGANVIFLERPVRVRAMIHAVQSALRTRRRQYDTRSLIHELANARARTEDGSEAKEEFLATVSHELRTPLNAILGWTRMLRRNVLAPEKRQRALDTIERNALVQMQLVEDLLDVSQAVAGELALDRQPMDLQSTVQCAVDAVRPLAAAKRLDVRLELAASSARLVGDAARLRQVAWTLLDNAIKFTPPAGRVRVRLDRTRSRLELTVADDGVGIAPEFLGCVFGPFQQADSSATRPKTGLGIGLAIVRHIVESHGGSVRAFSEGVGRGTTFLVSLPVAGDPTDRAVADEAPGAPSAATPARVASRRLDGVRVLVVDDGGDAVARRALEVAGASVSHALAVEDPAAAVRRSHADVLVFDCAAAPCDGAAWIRRVRDAGCLLPALALTVQGRVAERSSALAAGFTMHLPKPVGPRELADSVDALVEQFGALDRAHEVL